MGEQREEEERAHTHFGLATAELCATKKFT